MFVWSLAPLDGQTFVYVTSGLAAKQLSSALSRRGCDRRTEIDSVVVVVAYIGRIDSAADGYK